MLLFAIICKKFKGQKLRKKGLILTILGVFIMSFESPIIKFSQSGGFEFLFYFGICIFLTTIITMFLTKSKQNSLLANPKWLVISAFCMALSNVFFIYAVKFTGISVVVLILATSPIFCALIDLVFTKTKTPGALFVATFFILIGLYIVIFDDDKNIDFIGVLCGFLVVVFFAIFYTILSHNKDINRLSQLGISAIFMVLFALPFIKFEFDVANLLPILIMGIFVTPLSRVLIGEGSKYILSAEVGLLIILESILAPIWGVLFLGEKITTNTIFGGFIMLVSVGFYILKSSKR